MSDSNAPSLTEPPTSGPYWLDGVTIPSCFLADAKPGSTVSRRSLFIDDGRYGAVGPPRSRGEREADTRPTVEADGRLLTPTLVDCHVHLDKCHIAARTHAPEGDLHDAIAATEADKREWTATDLRRRAAFALKTAYANGVSAMRTHVDHPSPHKPERLTPADPLGVFAEIREEWAGRVDLQVATLTPLNRFANRTDARLLATQAAEHGFVLGAFHYRHPDAEAALRNLFELAGEHSLAVDLHVDEGLDEEATGVMEVADAKLATGFSGRVLCGHICSLAAQPDDIARQAIQRIAEARISVVVLPTTNLYLQDRCAGTPRRRGVTLLHELRTAGVDIAIGADNVRDPFYPYGDFDPLSVLAMATPLLHLRDPLVEGLPMVTSVPRRLLGICSQSAQIEVGAAADAVLWSARDGTELLARPSGNRTVLREGRPVDATTPAWNELSPRDESGGPA